MKIKRITKTFVALVAVAGITFMVQSFAAPASTSTSTTTTSTSSASTKKFVKTKNKCSKCSCSGYWGYKHNNGTYEGACSNRDSHGHTCGHGSEKHGLRKW